MIPGIMGIASSVGGGVVANTLTIASGEVSANINDYPVYVDLSDLGSSFWATVASDGSNLRVKQSGTDLPIDLVYFDHGGQAGDLFFKANLLTASDNIFTVEVVSGATAPAAGDSIGRNAVWSAFERVMHGRESVERTGSGATITTGGTVTFSGGKAAFAANGYIYMTAAAQSGSYSMFFYGFATGFGVKNYSFMSFSDSWDTAPNRQTMAFRASTEQIGLWNNTNGWIEDPAATSDPVTFTAGMSTASAGTRRLYVQGAEVVTGGSAADIPSGASPVLILGMEDSSLTEDYENDMYLACLSYDVLPAAWFAAMNTNLKTPTSFYTVS